MGACSEARMETRIPWNWSYSLQVAMSCGMCVATELRSFEREANTIDGRAIFCFLLTHFLICCQCFTFMCVELHSALTGAFWRVLRCLRSSLSLCPQCCPPRMPRKRCAHDAEKVLCLDIACKSPSLRRTEHRTGSPTVWIWDSQARPLHRGV